MACTTVSLPSFLTVRSMAARSHQSPSSKNERNRRKSNTSTKKISTTGFGNKKRELQWQCVKNCGACCKLDKGPTFPSPEEVFDDPSDVEHYKSLIGPDGWCIHFDKATRKCSIYADRPYFCRVEPDIFQTLYGIDKKKFNKEACSSCIDTIKAIYGSNSKELDNFNHAIWSTTSKFCDGPYEEPLLYTQEGVCNESNSVYHEAEDGFLTGSCYSDYRLADQVHDTVELYNGSSDWIDEYKSYFASCWGEDLVPHGYSSREYEDYKGCLEKAEANESGVQEGSHSSFTDSVEGVHTVNPWPGYYFELGGGINDCCSTPGKPNLPPENDNEDSRDYLGLWEGIFGYWSCLQRLHEEDPSDLLFTYSVRN